MEDLSKTRPCAQDDGLAVTTDRVDEIVCNHCHATLDVSTCEPFTHIECPSCHAELPVPAQLANFVLLELLGQGGMGAVFKGFDSALKRNVAIKVMKKEFGENPQFVEQFLREARALAALNHPNIVQIYNYGEEKGQPYIVMELVDGGRLDLLIKSGRTLDENTLLYTTLGVVKGLHAAANAGLTHGDIKPANILYGRDGTPKVVDFGLARFQGEKPRPGEVWGTPFYVAPEVVRGKQPDQKADIFSLGGTLFHAFAGRPPFNGKTVQETVVARFKEKAADLRKLRPELHPETASMVARMLEADPFMRYPNYDSLQADLKAVQTAISKGPVAPPPRSKAPLVLIISTLLLLGAIGATLFVLKTQKTKPAPTATSTAPKRVVMKLVDGKLVPVAVSGAPEAPTAQKGAAASLPASFSTSLTTASGRGADAYIAGSPAGMPMGASDFLWVKAGLNARTETARKIYLRFDLSGVDRTALTNVILSLTSVPTSKNKADESYALSLWGLNPKAMGTTWAELSGSNEDGLTWNNAPANDGGNPSGMTEDADLLAVCPVPANPSIGEQVIFSNAQSVQPGKLLDFLRKNDPAAATFIITADTQAEQKAGWKFSSKENAGLRPPTLLLQGLREPPP